MVSGNYSGKVNIRGHFPGIFPVRGLLLGFFWRGGAGLPALRGSRDGGTWVHVEEQSKTIGRRTFPPRLIRGPRLRISCYISAGYFDSGFLTLRAFSEVFAGAFCVQRDFGFHLVAWEM